MYINIILYIHNNLIPLIHIIVSFMTETLEVERKARNRERERDTETKRE